MINDYAQGAFLANVCAGTPYASAILDINGKPLNGRFPTTQKGDLIFTDFSFHLVYRPVVKKKYADKYFVITDFSKGFRPIRFNNLEELKEIAKTNKVMAFILKWGAPITEQVLQIMTSSPRITLALFGVEQLIAYDKYLREEIKKETGSYPPPEQSMFGAEWGAEAYRTYCLLKSAKVRDNDNARYNCGHAVRDVITGAIK